jgi:hypothetical protein
MGRFFFDLQGAQNARDPTGLPFESELDAFRAAQRLAAELWKTRPEARQCLRGGDPQKRRRRLLRERVRPRSPVRPLGWRAAYRPPKKRPQPESQGQVSGSVCRSRCRLAGIGTP